MLHRMPVTLRQVTAENWTTVHQDHTIGAQKSIVYVTALVSLFSNVPCLSDLWKLSPLQEVIHTTASLISRLFFRQSKQAELLDPIFLNLLLDTAVNTGNLPSKALLTHRRTAINNKNVTTDKQLPRTYNSAFPEGWSDPTMASRCRVRLQGFSCANPWTPTRAPLAQPACCPRCIHGLHPLWLDWIEIKCRELSYLGPRCSSQGPESELAPQKKRQRVSLTGDYTLMETETPTCCPDNLSREDCCLLGLIFRTSGRGYQVDKAGGLLSAPALWCWVTGSSSLDVTKY